MRWSRYAQTATEYLVILAVVLIIALIVVTILVGTPGVGTDTGRSAQSIAAYAGQVGIEIATTTLYGTSFLVRNNAVGPVQIDSISIDGVSCGTTTGFNDGYFPDLPQRLNIGRSLTITCQAFRYTSDAETTSPVSDNVYDADAEYKGNLIELTTDGATREFDVIVGYTILDTGASYVSETIEITSDVVGLRGYPLSNWGS